MSRSYGFLSTYPPTQCGLATFSAALGRHLADSASTDEIGVVRVAGRAVDRRDAETSPGEVVGELIAGSPTSLRRAVATLNEFDVALVQHEYGIFGGPDGAEILNLLEALAVPSIVVLHTVPVEPTPNQRFILERIADLAGAVVVMTDTAHRRLISGYAVESEKVELIPHGAAAPGPRIALEPLHQRPTILTWGLLGPGKGIEWGIDAVALLSDLSPAPRYLVLGQTHPVVRERDGESYRESLIARARRLGVEHLVEFDSEYRSVDSLQRTARDATVVLLPYDSRDQVTSGVLTEAVTAGTPVVATAFPHAIDVLTQGAGLVVPQGDAPAMAAALRRILVEPGLARQMANAGRPMALTYAWPAVADRYRQLAERLGTSRTAAVA